MATQNVIDAAMASSVDPTKDPSIQATPASARARNVIDSAMGLDSSVPNVPVAPPVQADRPAMSSNVIDVAMKQNDARLISGLTPEERAQSQRPDPENQVDEPWYSKTWDWLNRPLYDAHKWGYRTGAGTIERGITSGVEDLISGLSSPLSIAITAATFAGAKIRSVKALIAERKAKADSGGSNVSCDCSKDR